MNDDLVKRLRYAASYDERIVIETCKEAADVIEELVRKEKFHTFLWNTIQPNEMEQYIAMYRALDVPQEPPKEGKKEVCALPNL